MKLIIAGTRDLNVKARTIADMLVLFGINADQDITEIVSGQGGLVDHAGEMAAITRGLKVKHFPADWNRLGKSAGPIRNAAMAEYADALLLVWDGCSRGSSSMKAEMEALGKPVYQVIVQIKSG